MHFIPRQLHQILHNKLHLAPSPWLLLPLLSFLSVSPSLQCYFLRALWGYFPGCSRGKILLFQAPTTILKTRLIQTQHNKTLTGSTLSSSLNMSVLIIEFHR